MHTTITRLFIIDQTLKDFQGHHFEYAAAIAEAAQAQDVAPVVVANRHYEVTGAETAEVVPWFQNSWHETSGEYRFWEETLDFLRNRGVTAQDIVLIHTVSLEEFHQIVDFYETLLWGEAAVLPTVYVILRRDPEEYTPDALAALQTKLRHAFEVPDLAHRLVLCTDTEPLREAWSAALNQSVLTLPIPFRHNLVDRYARERKANAPLQIVYLGDARVEKGYQHFPPVVQALWAGHIQTGRVEVTLQSNFNTPKGEGDVPQARLKLQRYPRGVTLLKEPLKPEDYYAVLAKADIIVLPYDPERYARRSSGVMNEAISAGKVTVVPEGTWLALQGAPDRTVTYEHPSGLAAAVLAAVENFESLSRGARAYQPLYRKEQSPEAFVRMLIAHRRPVKPQTGETLLYVMDGDAITNRSGSAQVSQQQLQALVALGYRVHAVFHRIYVPDWLDVHGIRQWMAAIREEMRGLRLQSVWGVGHMPFYTQAHGMSERQILRDRDLRLDAEEYYRRHVAIPGALIKTLREDPPQLVLANYFNTIPFARLLAGPKVPILCETHDIQTFQLALRHPQGYQDTALEQEMNYLRQAQHIIALNKLEADFFADHLGAEHVTFIPPQPVNNGAARLETLAGAADLAELVETCGAIYPAFGQDRRLVAAKSAPYFRQAKAIDLLFISSHHTPNLEALKLFLHHVFYPRLRERGVTLAVAGMVCDGLGDVEGPQILLAHRVRDLEPLYAAAKIVILPILEGAGSAIKSVEAMSRGKPVVATSFALRGVDCSSEPFPAYDDWFAFGERILALLASPQERLAAAQASYRLSLANGNDGTYIQRFAQALAATTKGKVPPVPESRVRAEPPTRLVEWNESIRHFNTLCSDCLLFGYVSPQSLAAYREAPLEFDIAEALYTATVKRFRAEGRMREAYDLQDFLAHLQGQEATREGDDIEVASQIQARVVSYDERDVRQTFWQSGDVRAPQKARKTGFLRVPLTERPEDVIIEQIYDLTHAPLVGREACVVASGMYPKEENGARWTGPETETSIIITLDRRYDTEIGLNVHGALDNEVYERAEIDIDGQPVPTLKWVRPRVLVALVPAAAHSRTRVTLRVPRTILPGNKDPRHLGLQLNTLEAYTYIGSDALKRSRLKQAFLMMQERAPEDLVFAGYRDLLRRDPDPQGNVYYVDQIKSGAISSPDFFRDLIYSPEFVKKYINPDIAEFLCKIIA